MTILNLKMAEFSKKVENTVGNGELARNFSFSQCFQKTSTADT